MLEFAGAANISDEVIRNDFQPGIVPPDIRVANLGVERREFFLCRYFGLVAHPVEWIDVLGNHDYGDYVNWDTEELKSENLEDLKDLQKEIGFDLLLNEWKQIEPVTKVQISFNNKKLRKSFEPRMAHSANVYGNYIVCFGGFNSMNN